MEKKRKKAFPNKNLVDGVRADDNLFAKWNKLTADVAKREANKTYERRDHPRRIQRMKWTDVF